MFLDVYIFLNGDGRILYNLGIINNTVQSVHFFGVVDLLYLIYLFIFLFNFIRKNIDFKKHLIISGFFIFISFSLSLLARNFSCEYGCFGLVLRYLSVPETLVIFLLHGLFIIKIIKN